MKTLSTRLAVVIFLGLLAAGCTGNVREVIGKAPLVDLDGVSLDDTGVELEIAFRNVNDRPLTLSHVAVELSLDEHGPARARRDLSLTIAPRGRDVVRLTFPREQSLLEPLEQLSSDRRQRLPWQMSLELLRPDGGPMSAETEGWLHPVPGQRNRFR